MHAIENTVQPEHFSSIRTTMWWSLITLTTVGYGDVSHLTPIGKQVGAFTAIMGVCVEALLTSIVDTTFANQISERYDLLKSEIVAALKDGIINENEMRKITQIQDKLGMSGKHTKAMFELLRYRHHYR